MSIVFKFISDNVEVLALISSFVFSIIGIIIGINNRKNSEKNEYKKDKRQEFLNKAELYIEEKKWDSKENPDICLFMTDFNATVMKKNIVFNYSKNVLDDSKYKHMRFYLRNIGKADINRLDICVTSQKNVMLCDIDFVKSIVENKCVNYSYCYDRKILKDNIILIDIAYPVGSKICNAISNELILLFRDSYDNLYGQNFYIQQNYLEVPKEVSNSDYKVYTSIDTALKCFRNPLLW